MVQSSTPPDFSPITSSAAKPQHLRQHTLHVPTQLRSRTRRRPAKLQRHPRRNHSPDPRLLDLAEQRVLQRAPRIVVNELLKCLELPLQHTRSAQRLCSLGNSVGSKPALPN